MKQLIKHKTNIFRLNTPLYTNVIHNILIVSTNKFTKLLFFQTKTQENAD